MSNLICYCLRVEKNIIAEAIEGGYDTVEALGDKLRVGTGCGGCRPDLQDLILFYRHEKKVASNLAPKTEPC